MKIIIDFRRLRYVSRDYCVLQLFVCGEAGIQKKIFFPARGAFLENPENILAPKSQL